MKYPKTIIMGITMIFGLTFTVIPALAAEFMIPEKGQGDLIIVQDETVKNLYAAGATVTIESDIQKDLHVAGGTITINGNIEDDLCVAGGTVIVNGNVGGSLHAVGGTIIIAGTVGEDLFLAGGNAVLTATSSIGGDLILGVGTISIDAPVAGKIKIGAGQVTINSKIGGDIKASVDELTLGSSADVQNIIYKSPKELTQHDGATIAGELDFEQRTKEKGTKAFGIKSILGFLAIGLLVKLLMMLAAGLVIVYLFRKFSETVIKESLTNFWPSLGLGFAGAILTPIVVIILLVTILGIPLAGLLGVSYALVLLLSKIFASILVGSLLIKLIKKQKNYTIGWLEVLVGVIVLGIVKLIPILGFLTALVFCLLAFGAIYKMIYKSLIVKK